MKQQSTMTNELSGHDSILDRSRAGVVHNGCGDVSTCLLGKYDPLPLHLLDQDHPHLLIGTILTWRNLRSGPSSSVDWDNPNLVHL